MLELIVYGDSYPDKQYKDRKSIRDHIRKRGYGSAWLVEDFHFPKKLKKSKDSRENNSNKSHFFIEKQDTGIWILSIDGKGKGAHSELQYLIDLTNGKKPKYVRAENFEKLFYGIFEEEKKGVFGGSDVLMGNLPKNNKFKVYKYSNLDELKQFIDAFLFLVKYQYNKNNVDRLCVRFLPKPKCEVDRQNKQNSDEKYVAEGDLLCENNNCARWINKKHLNNENCPICNGNLIKFFWEGEIESKDFFNPS